MMAGTRVRGYAGKGQCSDTGLPLRPVPDLLADPLTVLPAYPLIF